MKSHISPYVKCLLSLKPGDEVFYYTEDGWPVSVPTSETDSAEVLFVFPSDCYLTVSYKGELSIFLGAPSPKKGFLNPVSYAHWGPELRERVKTIPSNYLIRAVSYDILVAKIRKKAL